MKKELYTSHKAEFYKIKRSLIYFITKYDLSEFTISDFSYFMTGIEQMTQITGLLSEHTKIYNMMLSDVDNLVNSFNDKIYTNL